MDMCRGGYGAYIGQWMMEIELISKRKRERGQRKFMDVVKKNMKRIGVAEEDAENRVRWRQIICCGEP